MKNSVHCMHCGSELKGRGNFCPKCGKKTDQQQPRITSSVQQPVEHQPATFFIQKKGWGNRNFIFSNKSGQEFLTAKVFKRIGYGMKFTNAAGSLVGEIMAGKLVLSLK